MLIEQPSSRPTRKVSAAGIAGALTAALIAGVNYLWPGVGDHVGPVAGPVITAGVAFVAAYFTRERA
jgi:hypothetical protein